MKLSMMSYTMWRQPEHYDAVKMFELTRELGFDGIDVVRLQDMTAEAQTADLARWQPQPMRSFTDAADLKRFHEDPQVQAIPKSFINGVKDMTFDWKWRWAWDPRLSKRLGDFSYAEMPGAHCCFNCHPEELATAVIDLAEYEYRGEAYATEELWRKSPTFLGAA